MGANKMKVLVTGSQCFIGKNLILELKNRGYKDILEFDIDSDISLLDGYTRDCEFIFHLAGVNRPIHEQEFVTGNYGFTENILGKLREHNKRVPIIITSTIQAELDNPYGKSKKAGEDAVFLFGSEMNSKVFVYRLPNAFGKWCKPNYNSVVATFCHNIARGLDIKINDPSVLLKLVYIDDVVSEFIDVMEGKKCNTEKFCSMQTVYSITLGRLAELLQSFKAGRDSLTVPNMGNELEKKLYSTYLSYLPSDQISYQLKMNQDERGSFTEFLRMAERGQISINVLKPGITKGNHWHHTKCEKFIVVSGEGVIRLRKVDTNERMEYLVNDDKMEVVDIPPGYTHNIQNIGSADMVTIMWANECFDPAKPDTYYLEV
jgi:UDP-2-acetamido-2,6-beta-L-arabino-hexul-4-ose reductase